MTVKIAKRIVGYKVLEALPEKPAVAEELERAIESMNENVSRRRSRSTRCTSRSTTSC